MDDLAARRRRRGLGASGTHPRRIMDAIYASGALPVSPDEALARIVVLQLHRMGLVLAEEILPDGSLRAITSETLPGARTRPWRVSRPALGGDRPGLPDGIGMAAGG